MHVFRRLASHAGRRKPFPTMNSEASSSFSDRDWELQRPWATEEKKRVRGWRRAAGLPLLLAISTLLVYAQACWFGCVQIDDPLYLSNNAYVQGGLTWQNVVWSFTTFHAGFWFPLTWLSLMADSELFGGIRADFTLRTSRCTRSTRSCCLPFSREQPDKGDQVPWFPPCSPSILCTLNRLSGSPNARTF